MREVKTFLDMGCVFISIPKTATQSIWNSILQDTHFRPFQHTHASKIKGYFDIECPGKWEDTFKFCVVRNPIELITSWYNYHKNHEDISNEVKSSYPDDINTWVLENDFKTHWQKPEHNNFNPWWNPETNPLHQHLWVTNESGDVIVDCILKQENLSSEIKKLEGNVVFHRPLGKLNSTSRTTASVLSESSIEKIKKAFCRDFEMFGYDTGLDTGEE